MSVCSCPSGAALGNITNFTCGESFGQIQKLAFCRLDNGQGVKNSFVTGDTTAIGKLAAWTAKKAKTDYEKVIVTPFVEAPTQDGGDAITFGGGNETLGGVEEIVGANPTMFTFALRKYPQSVILQLKQLMCEKNLGVFFFNADNKVEAIQDASVTTTFYPIPVHGLFVGDKIHGGFDSPDSNTLSFKLAPNYSDHLSIQELEFNPLTDL